jgi:hypothetical protein
MSIDLLLDPPLKPSLLEVAHVAHRLCFTHDHVREMFRLGKLPGILIENRWRMERADLDAYIDQRRVDRRGVDAPADRRMRLQPRVDEAQG